MRRAAALAGALVAVTGCGGGGSSTASSSMSSTVRPSFGESITTLTAPPRSTTTPAPKPASKPAPANKNATTSTSTSTSPEKGPGGAGDEQAPRVPAAYSIRSGRLSPRTIGVPAFFPVELLVYDADTNAHRLRISGPGLRRTIAIVPATRTVRMLPGLRKGTFALRVDGRPAGTLVSGVQPGP